MSYFADKLQAQNWVHFDFKVKFNPADHGQLPLRTTGTLTKVF